MTQQDNFPRCHCPQCTQMRRKYPSAFDAACDSLARSSKELQKFMQSGQQTVQVVGDIPPQFEAVIKAAIAAYFEEQNPLKETINAWEEQRLASIRKATQEADPEEDVWGEDDTEEDEPDWLKQDAQPALEQEDLDEVEDNVSSLLTLVEALRQQILASQRLNASALSILEILTEQL